MHCFAQTKILKFNMKILGKNFTGKIFVCKVIKTENGITSANKMIRQRTAAIETMVEIDVSCSFAVLLEK